MHRSYPGVYVEVDLAAASPTATGWSMYQQTMPITKKDLGLSEEMNKASRIAWLTYAKMLEDQHKRMDAMVRNCFLDTTEYPHMFEAYKPIRVDLPKDTKSYPLTIGCPDGKTLEVKYDGKVATFTKGSLPYNAEVTRLSDICGNLRHELEEIKLENSDLRREKERLERKLGRK